MEQLQCIGRFKFGSKECDWRRIALENDTPHVIKMCLIKGVVAFHFEPWCKGANGLTQREGQKYCPQIINFYIIIKLDINQLITGH
jgi:hypothetical protein